MAQSHWREIFAEEMWESERSLENWGEAQTVKKGFPPRNELTPQDPCKKSDVVVHAQSHHGNTRDKQIPGRQVPGQGTAPKVFLWLLHVSTCTYTYLNTSTHTHTQQGRGIITLQSVCHSHSHPNSWHSAAHKQAKQQPG